MGKRRAPRAEASVLHDAAVFSPSGTLIRLRRGNKHAQAIAAIMAASPEFTVTDAAAADVALLEAIRRGSVEVI